MRPFGGWSEVSGRQKYHGGWVDADSPWWWRIVRWGLVVPLVGDNPLGDILSLVYPVVITGALASLVSYRFIDGLAWLLPPLAFVLVVRVAWRVTLLPYRDWKPASRELPRIKVVRNTDGGSRLLYVLQPGSASTSDQAS